MVEEGKATQRGKRRGKGKDEVKGGDRCDSDLPMGLKNDWQAQRKGEMVTAETRRGERRRAAGGSSEGSGCGPPWVYVWVWGSLVPQSWLGLTTPNIPPLSCQVAPPTV